jgi:thiol-disulfide isomerase/thioredoxin
VRITICMGLVTVSLTLAGCSALGKKTNTAATGSRPFSGAADHAEASDTTAPPAETNGFLAGQVVDRFNHRPSDVRIQVVDLQEVDRSKAARIDFQDVKDGYFMIQGLKPGRQYQLIARAKVGDKLLAGTTVAQPPNPRLAIYLSEDLVGPETPPLPAGPAAPEKKTDPAPGKDGKQTGGPGATLDPPVKSDAGAPDNGPAGAAPAGTDARPSTPRIIPAPLNKVVEGEASPKKAGPTVDVPHAPQPDPAIPTPPGPTSRRDDAPVWSAVGGPAAGSAAAAPPPVPSCQLFGRKLENFALYGLDGQPWEFRRDRKGKVVLIDFWSTTCTPCLNALPELKQLQNTYGPYGLEVVGIAYEKGPVDQQVEKVRNVRTWQKGINYTLLLGGNDPCPVRSQFQVNALPTLVLIDDKGECVWRKEGLGPEGKYELELEIRKRLGLPWR